MADILVIDDSLTAFMGLVRDLGVDGHQVRRLDKFVDLPRALKTCPSLILLDLEMPALPGRTVAQYIRKYQPREIPLVLYSSVGDQELEQAAREIGAVAWIPKRCTTDVLRRSVSRILHAGIAV